MGQFAIGLALLAVMGGCSQRSCSRGPFTRFKKRTVHTSATQHHATPRLSLAPAIGDVREHRWSADDRLLAVWSDHTFVIFDIPHGRELLTADAPNHEFIDRAEFSPDGRWLGVASHAREALGPTTLRVFSVERKVVARQVSTVSSLSWQFGRDSHTWAWLEPGKDEAEGMHLLVGSIEDRGVSRKFDLPATNGLLFWKLEWSQSGRVFVISGGDHAWLVDVEAAQSHRFDAWSALVVSRRSDHVVWADGEGFLSWTPQRKVPIRLSDARCGLPAPQEFASSRFAFSDDERTLASSGAAGVCLWNTASGKLETVLRQPGAPTPSQLAWFNADRGLVVDSDVWDVEHRRRLRSGFAEVQVLGSGVVALQVPDGPDQFVRLQSVDSEFAVHDEARVVRKDCSLDMAGGRALMNAMGESVIIACDKQPLFVELNTKNTFRRSISGGAKLSASALQRYLTIDTIEQVAIAEPFKEAPERRLIEREAVGVSGFDAGRLWMTHTPEWQKFKWASLDFSKPAPEQLARGTVSQPCGKRDMYKVGSHFIWSNLSEMGNGIALCDISSGRQLGVLDTPQTNFVSAVNANGTVAVVGSKRTRVSHFWFVGEQRTKEIKGSLYNVQFSGLNTVVAHGESGIITVDALTGMQSGGWRTEKKGLILAADAENQRVLVAEKTATLYNLENGNVIARFANRDLRSAAFGANSLLVAADEQRIWVWRLPSSEPVGQLIVEKTGFLFLHANGKFEASLPPGKLQAALTCDGDKRRLPLDRCVSALREEGLVARVFAK